MKNEYININTNKLHDELISAGITPELVESLDDKTWITFADDTDMTVVHTVIDSHNPEPLPLQPTETELLQQRITELEIVIDTMLAGGTL